MNQERIGQFIKELRKKEHLTQQQFAEKFHVTYQAVSKWETGKSIPDLSILKEISKEFHINIAEILEGKKENNVKRQHSILKLVVMIGLVVLVTIISILFLFWFSGDYEFKTLSSNCEDFNITGSAAYNRDKSSIYISNISYCGENDLTKYQKIECVLYEEHGNIETKISECINEEKTNVTLEEYLKNVQIQVDKYENQCSNFNNINLYLKINAVDSSHKTITYQVPLKLNNSCYSTES